MPLYDRHNSWSQFLTGLLEKETAYGKAGARSAVQKQSKKRYSQHLAIKPTVNLTTRTQQTHK